MLPTRSLLFFVFAALSIGFESLIIIEFFRKHTHERMLCWMAFLRLGLEFYLIRLFVMKKRFGIFYPALWIVVNCLIILVAVGAQAAFEPPPINIRWTVIVASAGAALSQSACVHLLRSTAVSLVIKHVFLRSKSVDAVKSDSYNRSGSDNNKNKESSVNHGEQQVALMEEGGEQHYSKWLDVKRKQKHWEKASRERVEYIRLGWKRYVDSLRDRATDAGLFSDLVSPLHFLVRLYMDNSGKGEAARIAFEAFDVDPIAFRQYIPQITLFLLYASFDNSTALQRYILEASGKFIHVAHAVYWFTTAFCLQGAGICPNGVAAVKSFLDEVTICGETPALELFRRNISEQQQSRVESSSHLSDVVDSLRTIKSSSTFSITSSFTTVDKTEVAQSLRHLQAFEMTPNFINELCTISRDIASTQKKDRKAELRRRLHQISDQYLPSPAIYMPVGNRRHSVVAIKPEESFPFYPKNRAPYLVTLEVVDYDYDSSDENMDLSTSGLVSNRFVSWMVKMMSRKNLEETDKVIAVQDEETEHLNNVENQQMYGTLADKDGEEESKLGQWSDHTTSKLKRRSSFWSSILKKRGLLSTSRSSVESNESLSDVAEGDNGSSSIISVAVAVAVAVAVTSSKMSQKQHLRTNLPPCLGAADEEDGSQCYKANEEMEDKISLNSPCTPLTTHLTKKRPQSSPGAVADWPVVIFKERWKDKEARLRNSSLYGHLPGWRLLPVIIKSCDDLRQEQLAAQFIVECHRALREENVPVWLRPYGIVATSPDSGVIEAVPDTVSIDALKKNLTPSYSKAGVRTLSTGSEVGGGASLLEFFELHFGEKGTQGFDSAQMRFVRSLAGYSVVCYLLQIKDRHNGNLLIDAKGHVLHIDLGYCLGNSPGGNFGFETAAFKLTYEMVQLLGGVRSAVFAKFRGLCVDAFMAVRKHAHRITLLVELSSIGNSHLPCFDGRPRQVVDELRDRLMPSINDAAAREAFESCVMAAVGHWRCAMCLNPQPKSPP